MSSRTPTNYWDYIRVEELLGLQRGLARSDAELANDEVLFITVHQVFELWFKLILRELLAARDLFVQEPVHEQQLSDSVRSLKRIGVILRVANQHWTVMETLQTREYLGFRDKLMGASGFQSAQMRQMEILLGLEDQERIPLGLEGDYLAALRSADGSRSWAQERVEAQKRDGPTLREALHNWLWRTPIDGKGPKDAGAEPHLDRFLDRFLVAHGRFVDGTRAGALAMSLAPADRERIHARYEAEKRAAQEFFQPNEAEGGRRRRRIRAAMVFIETYRELPLLAWPREVLDTIVELEQLFTVFRQRHARMVERVIGRRVGTGGSAGVEYLDQTALKYRVFRDLWAVRTLQIPRSAAPELEHAEFYGFKNSD
jgi:tryptophan 2,3-dioxygenase